MGAYAYWYLIPYEENLNDALDKLRMREFKAGRYNPVIPFPKFPITEESESPGPLHTDINQPLNETEYDGTRSILDLITVSEEDDFCTARIPSKKELIKYFGTDKPDIQAIESNPNFFEIIERGKGLCIVVYENETPKDIFFAGYSFD